MKAIVTAFAYFIVFHYALSVLKILGFPIHELLIFSCGFAIIITFNLMREIDKEVEAIEREDEDN